MPAPRLRIPMCLVAALVVLAVPARAAGPVPANFMGVVIDGPALDDPAGNAAEWKLMRQAGVRSVRWPVYWPQMQSSASAAIDFKAMDAVVAAAAAQRMVMLPIALQAPTWDAVDPKHTSVSFVTASAPARPAPYARFVAALARRYGTRGTFWKANPRLPRDPITQWQMWNEPNLVLFWEQQPFAKRYVALLKATRPLLRAADPAAKMILGGLPNNSWTELQTIYAAGGRGLFDEVALHPYSKTPSRVLEIIRRNRVVMTDNHDGSMPMQITEMGYSSGGPAIHPPANVTWNTTRAGQAGRLTSLYNALAANRTRFHITAAYWYSWYTPENTKSPHWEDYTGLRDAAPGGGGSASKPALGAYTAIARKLQG